MAEVDAVEGRANLLGLVQALITASKDPTGVLHVDSTEGVVWADPSYLGTRQVSLKLKPRSIQAAMELVAGINSRAAAKVQEPPYSEVDNLFLCLAPEVVTGSRSHNFAEK